MTPSPITIQRDANLGDVIALMKVHACRQIPVLDGEQLIGLVTDRDVRLAMNSPFTLHERTADQSLLNNVTAEACMTANPMTVEINAPASLAARLMKSYKFGSLPVVDNGKLVGIITVTDILSSYMTLLAMLSKSE
jgi:acetoin utilization protein AcuB